MRCTLALLALALVVLVLAASCTALAHPPDVPPASVRERLDDPTRLTINPSQSAGAITAERRGAVGWEAGLVDLSIETGALVVIANGDAIMIGALGVRFVPIDIPPAVFGGHAARLEHLGIELLHPLTTAATWVDDNEVRLEAMLELGLQWSIWIGGSELPLGSPTLPRVPVEIVVTGDGEHVQAELRAQVPGILWSWADLVRLSNLELVLGAKLEPAYRR